MKAMVFAAGVGSRLRPLTDTVPKALIDVGGVPMVEHVIRRLAAAGVTDVVVNLFHFADRIVEFLASKGNFGLRVAFSREGELLDTGGGLKNAAWFFDDGRPFFLHNVDVLSDIDLTAMMRFHGETRALATLAVQSRPGSRQLLFDASGRLVGRETPQGVEWSQGPVVSVERLGFTGIHVIDPGIFPKMRETGIFPITRTYLGLAGENQRIIAYRVDGTYWQDIGSAEKLEKARRYLADARANPFRARWDPIETRIIE